MKRAMALVLLWFTGCMSMTETQVVFIKMSPPQGMKFFVSAFELSDSVQALPLGKKPASFELSEKLRACLVKHQGELFSAHPNGALPIKVSINVKPNRSSRLASNGRFGPEICSRGYWDSGWQSITMMMHHKVWSLIYEVRCRYDDGGRAQKVSRIVNVDGATTEPPFLVAPIMLPFLGLVDNL